MADLGHAPPLQTHIFEEEKHGNQNNSGKTGNRSPPNLLALSQYYMERKAVAHNSKNNQNAIGNIKTLRNINSGTVKPLQALSSLSISSYSAAHKSHVVNSNRPRKLLPLDPPNQKLLASVVEESHHRILGGYRSKPDIVSNATAPPMSNKRAGAKRGGAGYAAAASRSLIMSTNQQITTTPANSRKGSITGLDQANFVNLDSTQNQANGDLHLSSKIDKDDNLSKHADSTAHILQRKDTFSIENPTILAPNNPILKSMVQQDT